MNYREASEVARQHPGAVLKRDDSGSFIVCLSGKAIVGTLQKTDHEAANRLRACEEYIAQLCQRQEKSAERETALRSKVYEHMSTIDRLERVSSEASRLSNLLGKLRLENTALHIKLAKVSETEWKRIGESDELERKMHFGTRHDARTVVKCACHGEVEKCARCFGRGEYTADGFGNPV